MSTDDESMTPAEIALVGHLTVLREVPASPPTLTERVVRAARWQRGVRTPLLALAQLATAAADAVRMLVGGRS